MARRRKPQARVRKRKRKPVPGWAWLLGGLVPGFVVALAVYYYPTFDTSPEMKPTEITKTKAPVAKALQVKKNHKPDLPAKRRFDFYTLLPEMEVVIPEEEINMVLERKQVPVNHRTTYILQVGSFKKYTDADKLKARLALLGVHASIETVKIGAKTVWHRVRIGPSRDVKRLRQIRIQLQRNAINTVLLQARG